MAVVLITGCSSGFGLETALAFSRRGDKTFASMRDLKKAHRLHRRAEDEGLDIEVLELDVTVDASVTTAMNAIRSKCHDIDVLVNNAGVGFTGPVETIDIGRARMIMETNLWGAVRMIRAVAPLMRRQRHGVIINVSSMSARVPGNPYDGFYGASKHALGALSESLAWELSPFGIRVVCIEPGFFSTDIFANSDMDQVDQSSPYAADNAWINNFQLRSVEKGGGDPADVAAAITKAVDDLTTPLHNLVGDDAWMYVEMAERAGTFENLVPILTQLFESVSGPRSAGGRR